MIKTFIYDYDKNEKISKNFRVKEFRCKDGSQTIKIDIDFVKNKLQAIRDAINKPIVINSAYRTTTYNKKVGGATKSYHMYGRAFDIRCAYVPPRTLAKIAEQLDIKGIILYDNFVHVDSRDKKYWAINHKGKATPVQTFKEPY